MKKVIMILLTGFLMAGVNVFAEMYLDSNGNIGIGTTTPGYKLSVNGTIESTSGGIKLPDGTYLQSSSDVQKRISSSCAEGSSIRTINIDGTVVCEVDNGSGGITVETDPKIGSNLVNYMPKWNGSTLASGTIYDNGMIGIGTSNPQAKLELYSSVAITDWWPSDAYVLRLDSGSVANPLNTIQIIKSYGNRESELRFDNGDDILAAIYTNSNDLALNFVIGGVGWNHVTFEDPDSIGDLEVHLRAGPTNEAALIFNNASEKYVTEYTSKIYRPSDSNDLVVNLSGVGDVMTFNSLNGNVGIGTASPQSSLQVDGYVQLDLTAGFPPLSDCDETSERGRMKVDSFNGLLYICVDSGWIAK